MGWIVCLLWVTNTWRVRLSFSTLSRLNGWKLRESKDARRRHLPVRREWGSVWDQELFLWPLGHIVGSS